MLVGMRFSICISNVLAIKDFSTLTQLKPWDMILARVVEIIQGALITLQISADQ